ncbi:MAG TPA: AraC family transcriptional regulator [Candidatus Eisenbergiella merdavium]|uniref:AraC family transcriptional regulator n=1 Tax=Candidatus Eisenbergiella merdavium TaxID=2838551 RepID=A0A9D2SSE1_9FIRM|nr:AraC family transcriptional regulator [Candidatus Eisenbergiella merdavium]
MRQEHRTGELLKNKRVYIRLILTYLAVFLIPLVISIQGFEKIADDTQKSISRSVLSNLEHARDTLDNNFQEIDTIVERLTNNSTIRYVATQMDQSDKNVEISKILSAQNYLKAMQIQTFVEEYYLYFFESEMIISPEQIFYNEDSMKNYFCYDGMEWEEWKERMLESYASYFFPEAYTRQNRTGQEMILYAQSLVTVSGVKGTFIFPIKSEAICSLLEDTYVGSAGWGYVLDKKGNLLLTVPSEEDEFDLVPEKKLQGGQEIQEISLSGRQMQVIRTQSAETGLTFVAVLPKEYISAQIYKEQADTLRLMVIAVVVGIACILLVSWTRGRRIDQILQMIFSAGGENAEEKLKGNEMIFISDSLRRLISSNNDLRTSIREKELMAKSLLLENLLYGTENRAEESLEEYGIRLAGKKLLVIVFQFGTELSGKTELRVGDIPLYKQLLQGGMSESLSGECYMCDLDMDRGAFICTVDQTWRRTDSRALSDKLRRLTETFREECGIRLRLAISNPCEEPQQISKTYDQVYEILQYGPNSGRDVLVYEDDLGGRDYYYFPIPLEERLVNAVRTGNEKSVHDQLQEVYQMNVLERGISPEMMHFLVNDLQCTVFRALHGLKDKMDIEEDEIFAQLEQLNRETDILVRFNRINVIFQTICGKVKAENEAMNGRLYERIQSYIMENYSKSDLSLTKIADDFGYASTYFSRLFKELFQENFATFLEKARIGQVCRLLEEGDTMETIAGKTGYNSVYVMRTAFKRVKGVTPNDYRRMRQESRAREEE